MYGSPAISRLGWSKKAVERSGGLPGRLGEFNEGMQVTGGFQESHPGEQDDRRRGGEQDGPPPRWRSQQGSDTAGHRAGPGH